MEDSNLNRMLNNLEKAAWNEFSAVTDYYSLYKLTVH
jgi:hypothetical protein